MAKTKTHIDVSNIEAKALIFADGNRRYVIRTEPMDYIEFRTRHASDYKDGLNWKQATAIPGGYGGWEKRWFAIIIQDCMEPPIAIVRAEHETQAIDIFVDKLDWTHINETDLEDYRLPADKNAINLALNEGRPAPETEDYADSVSFNSNGQAYDAEHIMCWEVRLIRIELE